MAEVASNALNSGAINTYPLGGLGAINVPAEAALACSGALGGIADRIGWGVSALAGAASFAATGGQYYGGVVAFDAACSTSAAPILVHGSAVAALAAYAELFPYIPGSRTAEAALSGAALTDAAGSIHASAAAIAGGGAATLLAFPYRYFASQAKNFAGIATISPGGGMTRQGQCRFLHLLARTSPGSDALNYTVVNGIALNNAYVYEEWSGPYATLTASTTFIKQEAHGYLQALSFLYADPSAVHGSSAFSAETVSAIELGATVIYSGNRDNTVVCTLAANAGVFSEAEAEFVCEASLGIQPYVYFEPPLLLEAECSMSAGPTVLLDSGIAFLIGAGAVFAASSIVAGAAIESPITAALNALGGFDVSPELELAGVCTALFRLATVGAEPPSVEANVFSHPSWRTNYIYRSANSDVVYRESDDQVVYQYNQTDEV